MGEHGEGIARSAREPCEAAEALSWIVAILHRHGVPFQVVGGLAARAYGADRSLVDIDLYVPMRRFEELRPDLEGHIIREPQAHTDDSWELVFAALDYRGQRIELGDSDGTRIRDRASGHWVPQLIDFGASEQIDVLGTTVPVMPRGQLIAYKSALGREIDRLDIEAMEKSHRR